MNDPLALVEAAMAADAEWRQLQLAALDSLDVAFRTEAERVSAEQRLRATLVDLGAALLKRFRGARDADERAALLRYFSEAAPRSETPAVPQPLVTILSRPTEPVVRPAAPVEVARVTPEVLELLSAQLNSGAGIGRVVAVPGRAGLRDVADALPVLREAVKAFGEPPATEATAAQVQNEASHLRELTYRGLPEWGELADAANFALTGWLTARLRHNQELAVRLSLETVDLAIGGLIRRVSAHSKETQPGFVHGLALGHAPQRSSWVADATEWRASVLALLADREPAPAVTAGLNPDDRIRVLTERARLGIDGATLASEVKALLKEGLVPTDKRLVNLTRPYADLLDGQALAPLRRAIRELVESEANELEDAEAHGRSALPEDWPFFGLTRGRHAVIVGGDPRPERAARLEQTFGFEQVDWLEGTTTRRLEGLLDRMRNGSVDLVIVMRAFNSHKVSEPIFNVRAPNCTVVLADGYGVNQVRLGLERFLARNAAA